MTDRRQKAYSVRVKSAELARSRDHATQQANGDEQKFADDRYFMSFTKGLPHHPDTGLLQDPQDFVRFRRAIDEGFVDAFTSVVRHGAKHVVDSEGKVRDESDPTGNFRQWEAPTTGTAFDLEGPDCQSVTMAPAPSLLNSKGKPNPELVFEMAEVYELALLRDVHFNKFETDLGLGEVADSLNRLNRLEYANTLDGKSGRPRKTGSRGKLTGQTVFRGSSPGVEAGPYLSQFMLIGNPDFETGSVADGKIAYGAIQADQRVAVAKQKNYMQRMSDYVAVQRGLKPKREEYEKETIVTCDKNDKGELTETGSVEVTKRRFITTPRDFTTYVHYDALYEAYLNACLILLGMGTPFDPSFDHLSGVGAGSGDANTRRNAGGFALYGGPHILTLVTEVATRGLKAVRFQKFNNHIRLRPEALAERIELSRRFPSDPTDPKYSPHVPRALLTHMTKFAEKLKDNGTLDEIAAKNTSEDGDNNSYFLPMAFPEGSPMHPAYGAGHATVAGACVTILKAFFDTSAVLVRDDKDGMVKFKRRAAKDVPVFYRVDEVDSTKLKEFQVDEAKGEKPLTLEGELNKLAANISVARNMAGVHYFTDYYDSLRMGEQIAIGILEEQALCYPTDPFMLSLPTFDGKVRRIGRR